MRLEIEGEGFSLEREEFGPAFAPLARQHAIVWHVSYTDTPKTVAILVPRRDYCLIDLLWRWDAGELDARIPDRKSTRLNSSHANISYAVFCLKKKKHHTLL